MYLRLLPSAFCLLSFACASYNAYQKGLNAERSKDWDQAVVQYTKALEVDPDNARYKINLQRAKLEASRNHFEKGKTLAVAARQAATSSEQLRLGQLAATELQLTVKLDSTNQYAAVELGKVFALVQDNLRANEKMSIDDIKKRAKNNTSKAQPPQLNPASEQPISLTFPHETPVKEIYKALGNAFGINIVFDQAVKDDRIAIELKDVTAQQALERLMQAANHFYKVLDEHTIIVVPDNPQARRDYEDLVIQTFYLSNGDAEQVTNVVRTMIEARNLFPLKALNAITIRDTADKVRIAEKIIQANDKAKAEVVVDVELLELDASKNQNIGAFITGLSGSAVQTITNDKGEQTPVGGTRGINGSAYTFNIPSISYDFLKTQGDATTLANPELRISEGEKATLHIGQRIPVPVTTFTTGVQSGQLGSLPATSFQYQDVGIKVAIEPRVHHNREVTLKLTVEVSDLGEDKDVGGGTKVPSFVTRTIEATIRLKDGETNFLAGLIQTNDTHSDSKTPFLGDIPILGRIFTQNTQKSRRTDLMLTMTPHIIRTPDITDDDVAPMWVGTQNNLTFRGVSPRIESQAGIDPFTPPRNDFKGLQLSSDGEPGNYIIPEGGTTSNPRGINGAPPNDPFRRTPAVTPPPVVPTPPPQPQPQSQEQGALKTPAGSDATAAVAAVMSTSTAATTTTSALSPRISPQPVHMALKAGEQKQWNVIGMDLDGLNTTEVVMHYDPHTLIVMDAMVGPAISVDMKTPPAVTIDSEKGLIRISSSNGKPLAFAGGGEVAMLRVQGGISGDTYLVMDVPGLKNARGEAVLSQITGGQAKVE